MKFPPRNIVGDDVLSYFYTPTWGVCCVNPTSTPSGDASALTLRAAEHRLKTRTLNLLQYKPLGLFSKKNGSQSIVIGPVIPTKSVLARACTQSPGKAEKAIFWLAEDERGNYPPPHRHQSSPVARSTPMGLPGGAALALAGASGPSSSRFR